MRPIDAEALRDVFDKYVRHISLIKKGNIPKKDLAILADCVGMIDNAPTVDAVPVVRCKDCKYSVDEYADGECYCNYENDLRYIKDWDHYCAWAERKEE